MERASMAGGKYILKRVRDGAGSCGYLIGGEVIIGQPVLCGSITSRDMWRTTPVIEIVEVKQINNKNHYCKFKTGNSTYEVYSFDWREE